MAKDVAFKAQPLAEVPAFQKIPTNETATHDTCAPERKLIPYYEMNADNQSVRSPEIVEDQDEIAVPVNNLRMYCTPFPPQLRHFVDNASATACNTLASNVFSRHDNKNNRPSSKK